MKLKTTLSFLIFFITVVAFGQKSRFLTGETESLMRLKHIEKVKIKRSDTTNIYSATPQNLDEIQERNDAPQHFPYPIIFIHGLVGCADTWTEFYNYALAQGWSYGGHLRFNLNADENFNFSNIFSTSQSDVQDFNTNIPAADFYLVNFNCALDGTSYGGNYNTTTQSNQAAIAKQGLAIRQAVSHVLDATGKDKVILFGHSMGGLAARQYLQNSNLWQLDGEHHIAKLVTSATPHGGSNASFPGVSALFADVDESSDAVRDLRRTYFYSGNTGVFLYGGIESSAVMDDALLGFYDYDVNCNGSEGNQITGLNQKNLLADLDFCCIVGNYSLDLLGGDLVVGLEEAQLKTYYSIISETFEIDALHTSTPEYTKTNYEGFDEPDYYDLSYHIEKNFDYNGFITLQAPDAEYGVDYDDFVFTTSKPGSVSVIADNLVTYPFGISILGHPNYNYLFDQTFSNDPIQTQAVELSPGTYYLEFYATGNATSWQYPYTFRIVWSPTTAVNEVDKSITIDITPNPVTQYAHIKIETLKDIRGYIKIQNEIGQLVYEVDIEGTQIEKQINMSNLPDGMYFVSVGSENEINTTKIIKKQ